MTSIPLAASPARVRASHLFTLVALYVAQGLPYGFATTFLPIELAHRADFSYAKTSAFHLAALPWFLKLLWAPSTDARYSPRLGRRRSWILPAQGLLSVTAFAAAGLDLQGPLWPVFAVVALFNLWSAVQDTAVDGLAVELLGDRERGLGNAAQVGGYKVGMLLGGSGLVFVASQLDTSWAIGTLGLMVAALMVVPLTYREPPPTVVVESVHHHGKAAMARLREILSGRGWLPTLLFIGTVKMGETMVAAVLKPWLVRDAGFSDARAAFVVGVVGGTLSLAASVVGGWLAGVYGRRRLMPLLGLVQSFAVLALGLAVWGNAGESWLVVAIALEHMAVGLLTPVLFAWMMDVTDPTIGATHYTLLATTELLAKTLAAIFAGPLCDRLGVPVLLLLAGSVGALPLALWPWTRTTATDEASTPV
ncbi:MAG: major facilitator family transporter [Pseudomonadota bacterium]|jgi:MFS family permease